MNIKSFVQIPVIFLLFVNMVSCQNNANPPAANNAESVQQTPASSEYKAENEGWLVNLEEAFQLSQKTGKPIMANFTGSDWCGWCKRLTASVFVQDEFKKWAADNVILLEVDFPRRKQLPANIQEQNAGLQQAFQVRGYPTVWVFHLTKDAQLNQFQVQALGSTGYKASAQEFIADVNLMMKK
ncbi:MAG: thioredoxin family protein [Saprospiraceae bacterium]|nr:thioredoxin family protein [Saprospiraceae bacterium]